MRCVSSNRCMRIPTTSNAMQAQALDSSQVSLMVPATFYALSFSPCSFSHSTKAAPIRNETFASSPSGPSMLITPWIGEVRRI